jgi:hypothetical protein
MKRRDREDRAEVGEFRVENAMENGPQKRPDRLHANAQPVRRKAGDQLSRRTGVLSGGWENVRSR